MLPLTVRQCRDAADAVRGAEYGPAAVRRLRGERMAAFFRSRPGLAVLLYLAAAQGRVGWLSPAGFAVLEPPGADPNRTGTGRRARLARRVEIAWPYLRDFGPAILLLAAMPLSLLAGPYAELLLALDGLLLVLYLLALLAPAVLRGLGWLVRWLGGARRGSRATAGRVLDSNWSIGLCHLEDVAAADELLRVCLGRAQDLAAGTDHAGGALVCPDAAVTTERARVAIAVAMDYRSMRPGVRYPDELRAGVARCRVLLAIIHPGWLADLREPRDGPDWVHDEIAMALALGKTVIAVYFDDAPRLDAADLPEKIRELALRQSCRIRWRDGDPDADLDQLHRAVIAAAGGHR